MISALKARFVIAAIFVAFWIPASLRGQNFDAPPEIDQNRLRLAEHDPAWDVPPTLNAAHRSKAKSAVTFFENVVQDEDDRKSGNQLLPFDLPQNKTPGSTLSNGQSLDFDSWWTGQVGMPLNHQARQDKITPELLILTALRMSPRIRAISQEPLIREALINEANSEFDADLFVRTQFEDRTDPVGNSLTTGGAPFLKDHIWNASAGFRRKLLTGGEVELAQQFGFHNSNSRFFVPQDQGTATLALNYTQPLLRGAGKYYNRSQILIAQTNHGIAWDEYAADLQNELVKIVEAYWNVYHRRCVLIQKQKNVYRGEEILKKLEGRQRLDSLPSQIARARAAVQLRRTELANAYRDVYNAETEVRRLIGMPLRGDQQAVEMVPTEFPQHVYQKSALHHIVASALDHRPEIKEAMRRAKVASLQYEIAQHEVMPQLSLLFNTYVSALEGDSGIERAFARQFRGSTPGYSLGLEFEVPYRNRAARSRRTQRHLQMLKIKNEVDQTAQLIIADAQIALRRLDSAYQTMLASTAAIAAARADLAQQQRRWESFALVEGDIAEGQTPALLLDQLLDAQQRLTDAELTFVGAELEFKVAEISLKKATGELLQHEKVSFDRSCNNELPQINIHKQSQQPDPNVAPQWFDHHGRRENNLIR